MDWKLFSATFITIFVAELGDKTQFAAVAASSRATSVFPVWLAVVLALALAGSLGVWGGKLLSQFLNPDHMKWISGGLFIAIGIWTLMKKA